MNKPNIFETVALSVQVKSVFLYIIGTISIEKNHNDPAIKNTMNGNFVLKKIGKATRITLISSIIHFPFIQK